MCRSECMTGDLSNHQLLDEATQQFLRAVKRACGDKAIAEVITALEGPLGKPWKDRAIIHKLAGNYQTSGTITVRLVDRAAYESSSQLSTHKIPAIKTARALGRLGLVDAKRLIERAEEGTQEVIVIDESERFIDPAAWERKVITGISDLRIIGFEVNYL